MDEIQNVVRTPELIAAEIKYIEDETKRKVLYNAIEIGRRLVEAKALINHGEWSGWLKSSVNYSQSTADNFIRIFNEYGADQLSLLDNNVKNGSFEKLTYSQAVALLAIPGDEREKFIEDNNVEEMSTRELKQAIKDKENAEKLAKQYKLSADEKGKDLKALQDKMEKEKKASKEKIDKLNKSIDKIKGQLDEAAASGDTEEADKLKEQLGNAAEKIKELEEELKKKPIEVPQVIEKIPDNVAAELEKLRRNNIQSVVRYEIHFKELVKTFDDLLKALDDIKTDDENTFIKYKEATSKLITQMQSRLQ